MKILHIYKDFYPPVIGGIEGHLNVLCNGLVRRGINVDILVSNTKPKTEMQNINGIHIIKAMELGRFASTPLNLTFPKLLQEFAKKADLLHFHLPNPTAVLSYLASGINKPVIATYHSDIVRQARLNRLYRPFNEKFLKNAKHIITTSPKYIESSKELRRFRDKCVVIPLGVELERYSSILPENIAKIKSEFKPPIILFIGKFRYYKGLHILIDAMRHVDATLLIVGNGDLKARRELMKKTIAQGCCSKIQFLGELSDIAVRACLHACDIFVLPSILRSEAFGVVLIEAMACGKPVISTELGTGTTFINIHNSTGLVVQPNQPEKLAEAINHLITRPDCREAYGINAKNRARELFDADQMVETTIDLYQSCLGRTNQVK